MNVPEKLRIAPSLLSADFSKLGQEVRAVERAGADLLHVDVMDGHFVPNITIGPLVVASLRGKTRLPLDVHLMIRDPGFYLERFMDAGSAIITVHAETCSVAKIRAFRDTLRRRGIRLGVSVNPETPVRKLWPILNDADMILVMSVHPGFGGQKFIPAALGKIRAIRQRYAGDIEVDGGITHETAPRVVAAGANILVAGSYIFNARSLRTQIKRLRACVG